MRWRAAMGLQLHDPTPSDRTLRYFEAFLQGRHGSGQVPRYLLLHEHIVRCCLNTRVAEPDSADWATDSTPMWCDGAARGTVRLLRDGMRMLARKWVRATRTTLEVLAKDLDMPLLTAKSTKGAFTIDWSKPEEQTEVITALAAMVTRLVDKVRRHVEEARQGLRKSLMRGARNLMRVIETDLTTNDSGQLVVANKVARGRLVSITDPDARHGRKSKSKTFKGYMLHLLGDLVSGLIMSVTVTAGNVHDQVPAHRLIRRARDLCGEITQVLGDSAYGAIGLKIRVRDTLQVKLLAPPASMPKKTNKIGKSEFRIDFENRVATCPVGATSSKVQEVRSSAHDDRSSLLYVFSGDDCGSCPRVKSCCNSNSLERRILLHPDEEELRLSREGWKTSTTKAEYRKRSQCERLVNQLTRHGGRQARAFGLRAAQRQAHGIAMTCNLALLARKLAATEEEVRRGI